MRRRDFVTGMGVTAAAWPLAARAQSERVRRIASFFSSAATDVDAQADLAAFRDSLQGMGWKIGSTIAIEERWAGGNFDRVKGYAEELVAMHPDVILTAGIAPTLSSLKATKTIPIVFARVSDPVGQGVVASLARPGDNVTGFTNFEITIGSKWLQILKEVAPGITRVVVMANPQVSAFDAYFRVIEAAAPALSITPVRRPVHDMDEVAAALSSAAEAPGSALVVLPDGFMNAHRAAVLGFAAKHRLPAIYPLRPFAVEGGLIVYAVDTREQFRRAAAYADRILKGAKPGDLPVQEPTKYELLINLKTAKALGLTVPDSLLHLADEVIE